MMSVFDKKKGKTSTGAMREAAALLGRLRHYQLTFLVHKRAEVEAMVAQVNGGGVNTSDEDRGLEDTAHFDEFWNS